MCLIAVVIWCFYHPCFHRWLCRNWVLTQFEKPQLRDQCWVIWMEPCYSLTISITENFGEQKSANYYFICQLVVFSSIHYGRVEYSHPLSSSTENRQLFISQKYVISPHPIEKHLFWNFWTVWQTNETYSEYCKLQATTRCDYTSCIPNAGRIWHWVTLAEDLSEIPGN